MQRDNTGLPDTFHITLVLTELYWLLIISHTIRWILRIFLSRKIMELTYGGVKDPNF